MNILIYTPMFTLGSRVESLMHRLSVWSTNQNARLSCAALWLAEDAENWYSRKSQINLGASEFQNKTFSFDEIRIKLHKCFYATLGWNSPQAAAAIASALYTTTTTQHGLEKTEQCCSIVLCTRKLILECVAMTFPSHEFGINYYLRAQISYQQ